MDLVLLFSVGIDADINYHRKFVSHGSRIRSAEHDHAKYTPYAGAKE
jgi:hypothetical protein